MRYEIVSGKEYPVYSREEADELGLSYKHPYHVLEGEYGVSSDGEVAQCIKRSVFKNGRLSVKYPWGPSFIYNDSDRISSEGRVNNYTISGKNNRGKHTKSRDDFQRLAYLMAQPGMKKTAAIDIVFGRVKPGKITEIKRTMRTEVFRKMTKDELDKIVEAYPIGKMDTAKALAAVLDNVMDWDDDGKMGDKYDPKTAMTVLKELMDMNDMKGKGKVTTIQQIEASTTESTLADIQEKKKMFKATQTEEKYGLEEAAKEEEDNKEEA